MNAGLLVLHIFLGGALVAHALQKLVVFRLSGTTAYIESLGFRAPRAMALAVIGSEAVAGSLLALGLFIPLGALIAAAAMLVAARTDHRGKGWFITGPGAEYVVTNAVVAIALVAAGGGRYSLDDAFGFHVSGAGWALGVALAAVASAGAVLAFFVRVDAGEGAVAAPVAGS